MKKIYSFLLYALTLTSIAYSQTNQWTWVSGDNLPGQPSIFGTKGVPAPTNKPGGRISATSWTDATGKFWLFGGNLDVSDLWMYNPSTNEWVWVSGENVRGDRCGTYGTKGVPSVNNKPRPRTGAAGWTDASGNLWLFGGYAEGCFGVSFLNDLWKFNPSTLEWTWVSGDNLPALSISGVYGTKGVPAPTNKPGSREEATSWTDASGNLWLFGGYSGSSRYNDLWMYNPSTNQWTWVSGDNTVNQPSIYGEKGVPAPTNKPGARDAAAGWIDAGGDFWIMGGKTVSNDLVNDLNDLWKFNPSTLEWTWVSGDNIPDQEGVYGTKGIPALTNRPGGRRGASTWVDRAGNLWLFGGQKDFGSNNVSYFNDLWKYNPSTNEWTWVSGDNTVNQPGLYGTQGISAPTTKPGARFLAAEWTDASGHLWLFGGLGYASTGFGNLNDMWRFRVDTQSPPPDVNVPVITSFSPASAQVGSTVILTGSHFSPVAADNLVYFGAVKATVTAATATSLAVTVPAGITYGPISVTVNNLTAYSGSSFLPTFPNNCPGFFSNSFGTQMSFAAGQDPRNLATGDLDGDGKPDIVATNAPANTVSVFRNTGSGGPISFATKLDIPAGAGPERVALGDLDGDGKLDMAVANQFSNTVSVFRNTSTNGTIDFAARIDFPAGTQSRGVAIGDFDGDGKADLVVANTASGNISFLRNTSTPGSVSFAAKTDYTTGSGPHAIAVGDLDGDGKPDVAVTNLNSNTVSIFRNTGSAGTIAFAPKTDYTIGSTSFGIAMGDLDGDGKADLVVSSFANLISVFQNTSTIGTIAFAATINYPVGFAPLNVAIGDLDGDGKPDVALSHFTMYNFSVLKNNSTAGSVSLAGEPLYVPGSSSTNIVLADFDGDAKPDVATTAYNSNAVTVFKNAVSCNQNCSQPDSPYMPGLTYKYYEGAWTQLPDFGGLTPVAAGTSPRASLAPRRREDNFAFLWEGFITVPRAGTYTFSTASDDGSRLYIGEYGHYATPVVNNDGLHPLQLASGTYTFPTAGTYPIAITYFESYGAHELELYWSSPDLPTRTRIPDAAFSHINYNPASPGLTYKYYEGSWTRLPDFGGLTPIATGTIGGVDISPRKRSDNFAFLWEGKINILAAGTYYFETVSDDGSRLYIGNYGHYITPVVDNDGQHATRAAGGWYTFPAAGAYPIAITYFDATGIDGIEVYWTAPEAGIPVRTRIPNSAYRELGCAPAADLVTAVRPVQANVKGEQNLGGVLRVRVLPNPSTSHFTLQVGGTPGERVTIRVMDMLGRLVETKTTAANTNLQLGSTYRPGTYLAEVVQGSEKLTLKLVKTAGF
ncbi:VCBS repeat-containing protein [Flavisolibacter sp. BT320]|nr:VCBS repeat-containing protein [Flavisolibacter longurius]